MNAIFYNLIGKNIKVYIDDMVVKLIDVSQHLTDLEQAFVRIGLHNLKMNPAKCAFRVLIRNFLCFLVHH